VITGARCATALAPFVTHVLHPSWYQRRRSIRSRGQFMVTFPNSPIAHRDCLHGARCDEPPCRWLPRGTGDARASHTRGGDAAAPLLVMVWLLWCRGAVHRLGSMTHCVSLLPPTLLFVLFLSFFCFALFFLWPLFSVTGTFLSFSSVLRAWSLGASWSVLLWGSLSMGMTLTVIPSGSRTCQFHGRIPRNVCRGQRIGGGMHYGPSVIV
jgi:hypothetical protein